MVELKKVKETLTARCHQVAQRMQGTAGQQLFLFHHWEEPPCVSSIIVVCRRNQKNILIIILNTIGLLFNHSYL